jgi:hypothetical protein
MEKATITNKDRTSGLYNLALNRIEELGSLNQNEIIPFPKIHEKICRSFSITKKESWEVLCVLRDFDKIKIVPYHGVVIKYD